ncbi:pyridoxal-dependent decarboxylase [Olsenella sp. DSM 107455]|uniref:Pyridoxal-dependent decarboxylase n=1 Tax=Thermophilibacter gallinarum TaxID=2779357 RepID=A0ABR9QSF0_9ACTN|nr:pyridoxal-dependent decarboxylase [Thermophilibacter gallinarum]MBE5024007.1 pyridoxal-dependent decarboxylase [Thermophilibacter gallinarum]
MFSREQLEGLATPCFIFDAEELEKNLLDFSRALAESWGPRSCVGYSVKTNPFPWILDEARKCGCMAEVVSDEEYHLALLRGFSPDQIIFNGPVKGREWFRFAVRSGSVVNVDSRREIRWLRELSEEGDADIRVGVRANIDLERFCPGQTIGGSEPGRFGFCYEDGDLAWAISEIRGIPGARVVGLHMHVTTYGRFPGTYRVLASHAAKIIDDYALAEDLAYVDMGGGYYGGGKRNEGKYEEYARAISEQLSGLDRNRVSLYVEPGGAVICTPGYYVGRVVDAKDVRGTRFVVSELSRLNIDHEMKKTSYPMELFTASQGIVAKQELCGFTCMESDRMCELHDSAELAEGDIVLIKFAGAYSMSFTPGFFIEDAPAVYSYRNGLFGLLRPCFNKMPPSEGIITKGVDELV